MVEDKLDNSVNEQNKINTISARCENCGSNMVFSPTLQALQCPHCESVRSFESSKQVMELAIENAFSNGQVWNEGESVYRCQGCGASVVLSNGTSATICPYCETSHIVKSDELAGLKPNAVFPFTLTAENSVENATLWAKKRFFAPKKFKKNLYSQNLRGVYEPCFTFDSSTFSTYRGRVGVKHTRTVGSGKNRRVETYIVWKNISGTFVRNFDDIIINSTNSYSQKTLNTLMPYNTDTLVEYKHEFLTGYLARRYEIDLPTCWQNAKNVMDKTLRREILSQYHYDVVDFLNVDTSHSSVTYKYVLLPVYILNFPYKKKLYPIYINGNTGKVTGKTPISPLKVLGAVLLGLVAVVGLGLLIYFNL